MLQMYCEPASTFSIWQLRSAHASQLTVPHTKTKIMSTAPSLSKVLGVEQCSCWTAHTGDITVRAQKQTEDIFV